MDTPKDPFMAASHDLARITLADQSNSPLLRLPAELRNRIYAFTFSDEIIRVVPLRLQETSNKIRHFTSPVALLLTSRQLYAETNDLFVRTCIFDISQNKSRHEALETLGVRRCKKMEAIMLARRAIFHMMGPAWSPEESGLASASEKCFGALRWVYMQKNSTYSDRDLLLETRFHYIFGNFAFALVDDDRAEYRA